MAILFRSIVVLFLFSIGLQAHGGLTNDKADLLVEVSNVDGQWVYLKDKSGTLYKYPRKKFRQKKIKIHESLMIHSEAVKQFEVKKTKTKNKKPKQG